jgi:WD40 repeat protein
MEVFREGDAHTLQKLTDDFVTSASWSPDGSEIAFVRTDSSSTQIYKIDVKSLEETRLAEGIWPTWSPDGEKLAFVGEGGSTYLMDADGSNPTPIFDAAGGCKYQSWSGSPEMLRACEGSRPCGSVHSASSSGALSSGTRSRLARKQVRQDDCPLEKQCALEPVSTSLRMARASYPGAKRT